MKKEKLTKVENTNKSINNSSVENQEVKTSKKDAKAKASKKEAKAEKSEKPSKKEKLTKKLALQQAVEIVKKVAKERVVKYKYPEDVKDSLSRKTWRQKVRSKLSQLELAKARIEDQNSKEFKRALKEYNEYRSEVLQEVKTA
jgi:hypothetical protein|nr:MAG TPA: hypothetical protein [Caudoviricetes sp.]